MLPFAHPTMLAPMEGITHPTLRALLAERGGIGAVSTEFVRIGKAPPSARFLASAVAKAPGVPLSVQVMGNHVEHMAEAAGLVARAGADVVDINLGCPAPRVVRKGVGSAMLKDVRLLSEVVGAMRARVPGLLSAKIRAGFDDARGVLEIGRALEAVGVDFLVVHPRRRADFFEGTADWRIIRELKRTLGIPVVGNGDAWSASAALRMMAETGCDGVMMGRPALRNPWIFEQLADLRAGRAPRRPSGRELADFVHELSRRLVAAFPERKDQCVGKLKELLGYVGRAVPDERAFLRAVVRDPDVPSMLDRVERTLAPLRPHELDLDAEGSLGLERSGRVD